MDSKEISFQEFHKNITPKGRDIIRDAMLQLRRNSFALVNGSYCRILYVDGVKINWDSSFQDKFKDGLINKDNCQVCACGSLLISCGNLYNNISIGEIDSRSNFWGAPFVEDLIKEIGLRNIFLIEAVFERESYLSRLDIPLRFPNFKKWTCEDFSFTDAKSFNQCIELVAMRWRDSVCASRMSKEALVYNVFENIFRNGYFNHMDDKIVKFRRLRSRKVAKIFGE